MNKKILVLGATGAMGTYLIPELLNAGYKVDGVSIDDAVSNNPNLRHIKTDAYSNETLSDLLKNGYDGIVDFLIYTTASFTERHRLILDNTSHYIFLSSYRVYSGLDDITRETSPLLLDSSDDIEFRESEDYSITKARQENVLKNSDYKNWTIIRPAITYSKRRFQLVTCEANLISRAFRDKPLLLPISAKNVQATMTWAGDMAKIITKLLFNQKSMGECYTTSTSEHHTWGEIADMYKKFIGLDVIWIDTDDYLLIMSGADTINRHTRWQLVHDRLLNRVMDNSKILEVTGLSQNSFMPLEQGLKQELDALPRDIKWTGAEKADFLMEKYLLEHN